VEHIAIDLGKTESQICRRDGRGKILEEKRISTYAIGDYLKKQKKKARVIVETSSEAFSVADEAMRLKHDVRVVASKLAPSLGVGSHGIKTDRRDAQVLSEASVRMDLKSVHIPSQKSREIKAICGMRAAMVRSRTLLISNARGYLRTQRIALRSGASETFAARVRDKMLNQPNGMPAMLERLLLAIDSLGTQLATADKELEQLAEGDKDCKLLMSMPGVGPLTSILFLAVIDDVTRFKNGSRMESYLGLTPGANSSGMKRQGTAITKAGSANLRRVLGQAAWSFWRTRPNDPLVRWAQEVAKRRGKKVAIVALQRRMAGVLRAILRDRQSYNPLHCPPATPLQLPPQVAAKRKAGTKAVKLAKTPRVRIVDFS
jgi:transposase